jgi:hypothetical protein
MKTKRFGSTPVCRAFQRVRLRATSGRVRSEATTVFFKAQSLGMSENPNRPSVRFHTTLRQFHDKAAQGKSR